VEITISHNLHLVSSSLGLKQQKAWIKPEPRRAGFLSTVLVTLLRMLHPRRKPRISFTFGRHETVIYSERFASQLAKVFPEKDARIFDPFLRAEVFILELSVACFLWLFRRRNWTISDYYFYLVLKKSRASHVVTSVLANRSIFRVREALPQKSPTRFFFFQTGMIWLDEVPQDMGLRPQDRLFTYSTSYSDAWRISDPHHLDVVHAIGSLPSVIEKATARSRQRCSSGKVGFISSWREPLTLGGNEVKLNRVTLQPISYEFWFSPERRLLPHLAESLQQMGLRLEVLGSMLSETQKAQSERDFYSSFLGDNVDWKFSSRTSQLSNYGKLSGYDLLVAVDSALAYEALSLGFKVIFLQLEETKGFRFPPGYPGVDSCLKPLVLNAENPHVWQEHLLKVIEMPEKEFRGVVESSLGREVVEAQLEDIIRRIR